jgi:uncharacterized membrane protein YhaH (DUF805 family)
VIDDSTILSKKRYYTYYTVLHLILISAVLIISDLESGFLYWTSLSIIVLYFIFFLIRLDFVFPWYSLHVKYLRDCCKQNKLSRSHFNIIRTIVWIITVSWLPLYIILSPLLPAIIRFYVFLGFSFFSFYNSDYLFTNYTNYKDKLSKRIWRKYKRYW